MLIIIISACKLCFAFFISSLWVQVDLNLLCFLTFLHNKQTPVLFLKPKICFLLLLDMKKSLYI